MYDQYMEKVSKESIKTVYEVEKSNAHSIEYFAFPFDSHPPFPPGQSG